MTSRPTPADWLLAEFDATDIDELSDNRLILPIFTLKSVHEPGDPMTVNALDYQDADRRWL